MSASGASLDSFGGGETRGSKGGVSGADGSAVGDLPEFLTIGERRVNHIPGLREDELRHPLDRQNTQLISLLPGIEGVVKAMMSPVSEEVALLENIGTSVLVSKDQLPDIYRLLCDAVSIAEQPALFLSSLFR